MHPAIGELSNGKFYAHVNGYDEEPVIGTLEEVEIAMGLRAPPEPAPADEKVAPAEPSTPQKEFDVILRFEYPAWDEVDGILYRGIIASTKQEANDKARFLARSNDLLGWGKGRVTFTALEQ